MHIKDGVAAVAVCIAGGEIGDDITVVAELRTPNLLCDLEKKFLDIMFPRKEKFIVQRPTSS